MAAVTASDEVPAQWGAIHKAAPQLAETMVAYVAQIGVSMRPSTARAVDTDLRIFAGFLLDHDPALGAVADVERSHIEAFKLWQWAQPGISGRLKPATFRRRLGQLRTFFLRIIEWGWDDTPARVPIFFGDVLKRDEVLPRSSTTPASPSSCGPWPTSRWSADEWPSRCWLAPACASASCAGWRPTR